MAKPRGEASVPIRSALRAMVFLASLAVGTGAGPALADGPSVSGQRAEGGGADHAARSGSETSSLGDIRSPRIILVQPETATRSWLDWLEKLIQFAAVVIGGIWVWANYLLNRTHRARLEGRVTADVLPLQGGLVRVVLTLKNVGLSKVDLARKGTGLRIASMDPSLSTKPAWRHRMTVPVWESVDWLEPGESCEEQHLLKIPLALQFPIRLELYVICRYRPFFFRRRVAQTLRSSYVLPPLMTKPEVPT